MKIETVIPGWLDPLFFSKAFPESEAKRSLWSLNVGFALDTKDGNKPMLTASIKPPYPDDEFLVGGISLDEQEVRHLIHTLQGMLASYHGADANPSG